MLCFDKTETVYHQWVPFEEYQAAREFWLATSGATFKYLGPMSDEDRMLHNLAHLLQFDGNLLVEDVHHLPRMDLETTPCHKIRYCPLLVPQVHSLQGLCHQIMPPKTLSL